MPTVPTNGKVITFLNEFTQRFDCFWGDGTNGSASVLYCAVDGGTPVAVVTAVEDMNAGGTFDAFPSPDGDYTLHVRVYDYHTGTQPPPASTYVSYDGGDTWELVDGSGIGGE